MNFEKHTNGGELNIRINGLFFTRVEPSYICELDVIPIETLLMTQTKDDKLIEGIIHSFKNYGLGDIKHNRKRTISAFILSICLIDQLASFRYPKMVTDLAKRAEDFISEYIPAFSGLKLYTIFRHAIIHNYSSVRRYALTNDKEFKKPFAKENGVIIINTNALIKEIIKGFNKLELELLTNGSEARKNAIARAKKHPPLMHKII